MKRCEVWRDGIIVPGAGANSNTHSSRFSTSLFSLESNNFIIEQIKKGKKHHTLFSRQLYFHRARIHVYYMEESVLLGTKPLVDSIRHFIRDPSGVFSVCHLWKCRIVQWRPDSSLLLLLNWFLHIIKRTLHVGSKIWILCSRGKNNISLVRCAHSWDIVLATRT